MRYAERPSAYVELLNATAKAAASGEALRDALPSLCALLRETLGGVALRLTLVTFEGEERTVFGGDHLLPAEITAIPLAFGATREGTLTVGIPKNELTASARDAIESWASIVALALHQASTEADNRRLESMAQSDQVTGIANRRAFDSHLLRVWNESLQTQAVVSVLIADIDFFKAYNDRYGHLAGDAALRRVGSAAASLAQRPGDLAARLGGEEFGVILPDTDEAAAFEIAERLRTRIAEMNIEHENSDLGILSVSIGVVTMQASRQHSASMLVNRADALLYRAKNEGRNRAVSAHHRSTAQAISRHAAAARADIPVPATAMIGRADDLRRCIDSLDRSRLLTISGPHGIGKTRLAAALSQAPRAWNAVWYIDIFNIEGDQLYTEFARTFALVPHAGAPLRDQLLTLLTDRRGLLIVDGMDAHNDALGFLDDLLRHTRHLQVIALADAPLRLAGEAYHELRPLDLDAPFKLFVERRALRTNAPKVDVQAVRASCEAAGGIPQTIELVAGMNEPAQAGSLDSAIHTAYKALDDNLRRAASALAILAPGYSEETAYEVAGATAEDLNELERRSLVFRLGVGPAQYGMLRNVAQAGTELLGAAERNAVEQRRYDRYIRLAREKNLAQLQNEERNLRAALAYAASLDDPDPLALLASTLQPFWLSGAHMLEGLYWLEQALRRAPHAHAASEILANTWRYAGILSRRRSDYLRASKYNELALQAWRSLANPAGIASALNGLALVAHYTGDFERARRLYEESLELARSQRDDEATAMALQNLAGLAMFRADYDEAERLFGEALQLAADNVADGLAALIQNNFAELRFVQERYEEARTHARESLQHRLQSGETPALAATWLNIANIELSLGNSGAAWRAVRESLLLYRQVTDDRGVANAIIAVARLLDATGRIEEAARMAANADAILARTGTRLFGADLRARELLGNRAVPPSAAPPADFEQAFEEALAALNLR